MLYFNSCTSLQILLFSADGKYEVRLMTKAELKYTGEVGREDYDDGDVNIGLGKYYKHL